MKRLLIGLALGLLALLGMVGTTVGLAALETYREDLRAWVRR